MITHNDIFEAAFSALRMDDFTPDEICDAWRVFVAEIKKEGYQEGYVEGFRAGYENE